MVLTRSVIRCWTVKSSPIFQKLFKSFLGSCNLKSDIFELAQKSIKTLATFVRKFVVKANQEKNHNLVKLAVGRDLNLQLNTRVTINHAARHFE